MPVLASAPRGSRIPSRSEKNALTGLPLFLATVPARAVGTTALVYVFQLIFLSLLLGDKGGGIGALSSTGSIQTGIMGIMFASLTTMWVSVRSLRVLPISHRGLAALLISPALGVGILTAVFAAVSRIGGSTRPVPVQPWEIGLLVFGVACIGAAIMVRFPKVGVFLLIGLMAGVSPILYFVTLRAQSFAKVAPFLGAIFVLIGYILIARMLRRTSGIYRGAAMLGVGPWSGQQQR